MDKTDYYIKNLLESFKPRYNYFDDGNNSFETKKIIGEIILSEDQELINFSIFYFFVFEYQLVNRNEKNEIKLSQDLWQSLNECKDVIIEVIKTKDKSIYMKKINNLYEKTLPEIDLYINTLIDEKNKLDGKIFSDSKILIENKYKDGIIAFREKTMFGLKLNIIASKLNQIVLLEEYLNHARILIKDDRRYRFNFWLSLSLAVASILISIISICV